MAAISADPLIAEARRRARRRRLAFAVAALAVLGLALWGFRSSRPATRPTAPAPPPARTDWRAVRRAAADATVVEAQRVGTRAGWAMNGLGMWLTTDGGAHWHTATPPAPGGDVVARLCQVQFVDALHGWASGCDLIGRVFYKNGGDRYSALERTVDGGRTWTVSKPNCPACGGSVDFLDARRGFELSPSGLYRSADGGVTWRRVSVPQFRGTIVFADARHGWGWTWGGRVYRTGDGGRHWQRVDFAAKAAQPVVLDARHVVVPLARSVAVTADGGRTWTRRPMPPAQSFSASSPQDFVAFSRGALWSSENAGRTWSRVSSVPAPHVSYLEFASRDDGWAIFELGNGLALVHTSDGGRTWAPLKPPVPKLKLPPRKPICNSPCRRP